MKVGDLKHKIKNKWPLSINGAMNIHLHQKDQNFVTTTRQTANGNDLKFGVHIG